MILGKMILGRIITEGAWGFDRDDAKTRSLGARIFDKMILDRIITEGAWE